MRVTGVVRYDTGPPYRGSWQPYCCSEHKWASWSASAGYEDFFCHHRSISNIRGRRFMDLTSGEIPVLLHFRKSRNRIHEIPTSRIIFLEKDRHRQAKTAKTRTGTQNLFLLESKYSDIQMSGCPNIQAPDMWNFPQKSGTIPVRGTMMRSTPMANHSWPSWLVLKSVLIPPHWCAYQALTNRKTAFGERHPLVGDTYALVADIHMEQTSRPRYI